MSPTCIPYRYTVIFFDPLKAPPNHDNFRAFKPVIGVTYLYSATTVLGVTTASFLHLSSHKRGSHPTFVWSTEIQYLRLYPNSCTLQIVPCILHNTAYILHPVLYTLHPSTL